MAKQIEISQIIKNHVSWYETQHTGSQSGARADFYGCDLFRADLRNAWLPEASMQNANLREADLRCANLTNCDLRNSDLSHADMRGVRLGSANIKGSDFRGVRLRDDVVATHLIGSATLDGATSITAIGTESGEILYINYNDMMLRSEYEDYLDAYFLGTELAAATRACLDYLAAIKPQYSEEKDNAAA